MGPLANRSVFIYFQHHPQPASHQPLSRASRHTDFYFILCVNLAVLFARSGDSISRCCSCCFACRVASEGDSVSEVEADWWGMGVKGEVGVITTLCSNSKYTRGPAHTVTIYHVIAGAPHLTPSIHPCIHPPTQQISGFAQYSGIMFALERYRI